jgi:thiamine-monophosphate kinase
MSWSEERLHRWLARRPAPEVLVGSSGHDAAVLGPGRGRAVQCADQTIEGVHFESSTPARQVGRKAGARALSDLAATAATPRSLLLTIAAPPDRTEGWMRGVIEGVSQVAAGAGAALVGGDLARTSGPAVVSVFAHGELAGRRRSPGRDRARPGQRVVLTGAVGGSRLGRHLRIKPRLDQGRALFQAGATAMMDVSDGLAWDLYRLARASGVAIDLLRVPLHRDAQRAARGSGRSALDHGLHDGEDHELVACMGDGRLPGGCVEIGCVRAGRGLWLAPELTGESGSRPWRTTEGGWRHG